MWKKFNDGIKKNKTLFFLIQIFNGTGSRKATPIVIETSARVYAL